MASKVKKYNHYIVLHSGKTKAMGCTILGRYIVAAKNEKEAEGFVRNHIGKHVKVRTYYQIKEDKVQEYVNLRYNKDRLNYKDVIKE